MESDKKYKYQVGDIIITDDNRIGMIVKLTNAFEFLAFRFDNKDKSIEKYADIHIYEIMADGTITCVNESNIRGVVCKEKKDT